MTTRRLLVDIRENFKPVQRLLRIWGTCIFVLLCIASAAAAAAPKSPVAIKSIVVTPEVTTPGSRPDIKATILIVQDAMASGSLEVNIVAVVVRPDHVVKSWQWKKVRLVPGEEKSISIPKEYETKITGTYKIDVAVYNSDMSHRFHALSKPFTVTEFPQPAESTPKPSGSLEVTRPERPAPQPRPTVERTYLGMGVYANALNPAGGATLMIWPFRNVGLQGSYTVGTFTSYEGRLLVKIDLSSGFNPYIGAGYLHVSKKENIIGIDTTFTDSNISGVAGLEIPLGKKMRGYLEVSGTQLKLKKEVTNGTQSVIATVTYAPVTIGASLVFSLF